MCVYERGRDGQLKRQAEVCVCACMREGERRTVKETGRGVCACMREGETETDGQLKRQAEVCVCERERERQRETDS